MFATGDLAILNRDVPEHGLRAGDLVVVLDEHPTPEAGGEPGYSIELVTGPYDDDAVVTVVPASALARRRGR